ncbi:hypothetical protein M404DRAFT_994619 [Pisolithus tinctorius Marx 270]|uniref:F-box domain-containing protein n=1 Tax=Pisolithus tinctorius Marx 270 TaxID=870435 RepID=A0A0C3PS46_PISTI|nr:hypothetical protein M404DRAFT_994619 [Pisolithus tinctorius Marx 270]
MHDCLRILEILYHIIGFLVPERVDNACFIRHMDIAGLARTCKTFKDRAQPSLNSVAMFPPALLWTVGVNWGYRGPGTFA